MNTRFVRLCMQQVDASSNETVSRGYEDQSNLNSTDQNSTDQAMLVGSWEPVIMGEHGVAEKEALVLVPFSNTNA